MLENFNLAIDEIHDPIGGQLSLCIDASASRAVKFNSHIRYFYDDAEVIGARMPIEVGPRMAANEDQIGLGFAV